MTSISDSSAVREKRVLSQHQAALTLIQGRVGSPELENYSWLDLACGRGQIIAHLEDNLTEGARGKILFYAYDVDQRYGRETRRIASGLGFKSFGLGIGELSNFNQLVDPKLKFDFISLTNTVHELIPRSIAQVMLDSVARLKPTGTLFVYDMERIEPPELGAIPWNRDEIRVILFTLLDALSSARYRPEVSRWQHSRISGWNLQLDRNYIKLDDNGLAAATAKAIEVTSSKIMELMRTRLSACTKALMALTEFDAETADEEADKVRLLHEFWALTRALGGAE
ncbi:hypothetical protein SAE02_78220 [Skermanella aerolata]|uniref:Methyltransferase domain-containing protein n=1 Tax=Skermanella aerolata TaxID=393310 RepID=A0A512E4M1_9PROT|nr:class I SAM-dependent methyltransferase [Skermanella aerolata]KJB90055.1 hypothetical protein N826_07490 [Skermanella aerolata KACC 11604]GEO43674.1 hypothetical protein SAE02_78220 [Skermanella aerolata]